MAGMRDIAQALEPTMGEEIGNKEDQESQGKYIARYSFYYLGQKGGGRDSKREEIGNKKTGKGRNSEEM